MAVDPPRQQLGAATLQLLRSRQELFGLVVALTALDLATLLPSVYALTRTHTFGSITKATFDGTTTEHDLVSSLAHPRSATVISLLVLVVVGPVLLSFGRIALIQALCVRSGVARPPLGRVSTLATLAIIETALVVAATHFGTGAVLIVVTVLNVASAYSDVAIAVDGVGLVESIRASLHVLRKRTRPTLLLVLLSFILTQYVFGIFGRSIDNGEGTPVVVAVVVLLLALISACALAAFVTLYRSTPPRETTAAPEV